MLQLGQDLAPPGPNLRRAVSYFDTTLGRRQTPTWVTSMRAARVAGSGEPQAVRKELAPPLLNPIWDIAAADPRIKVPPGRNYGDDFYRKVASVYGLQSGGSRTQ